MDNDTLDIITCPNCGDGTCLQFLPMAWSVWAQCGCGYGWDMPSPNVSREVN